MLIGFSSPQIRIVQIPKSMACIAQKLLIWRIKRTASSTK
jgi:hypothetical protein